MEFEGNRKFLSRSISHLALGNSGDVVPTVLRFWEFLFKILCWQLQPETSSDNLLQTEVLGRRQPSSAGWWKCLRGQRAVHWKWHPANRAGGETRRAWKHVGTTWHHRTIDAMPKLELPRLWIDFGLSVTAVIINIIYEYALQTFQATLSWDEIEVCCLWCLPSLSRCASVAASWWRPLISRWSAMMVAQLHHHSTALPGLGPAASSEAKLELWTWRPEDCRGICHTQLPSTNRGYLVSWRQWRHGMLARFTGSSLNCNGARLKGLKVQNVRGRSLRIRCQRSPAWGAFLGCFFLLGPGGSNRYLKG